MTFKKKFFLAVILLFTVAFFLRVAVCLDLLKNDVQVSSPSAATDMATYFDLSRKIADREFNEAFYYQPFYYVVFLPALIFIFGKTVVPVLISQSFISALTVVFVILCASMLRGRRAGIYAGVLATFSSCLCIYVPYHLIETLQAFWIILIVYLSILALKRSSLRLWMLCGIIVSFAILSRGNIWFFVPGIFIASFLNGKKRAIKFSIIFPSFFLLMVVLPQLPFAYWNYLKTGKFSGPSTAAGAVLGLGNTPEAPPGGRNPGTGPGPMEYPETYIDWASQSDTGITGKIYLWAVSEPLAFIELQFRKILLFWDYREIPNNIAFEHNGAKSKLWRFFCFIPTSFLICGFIAWFISFFVKKFQTDILITRRKYPQTIILCLYFVFAYCLATAAFYNLARFRNPSLPLFAIFAGFFLGDLEKLIFSREENLRSKIKIILFSLFFAVFIVFFSYESYRFYEPAIMRLVRPHGTRVELSGKRTLILDNGPYTFGGWETIEIKEGMLVQKDFDLSGIKRGDSAKFVISIFFLIPGEMTFEINGLEKKIKAEKEGQVEQILDLGELKGSKIEIKFLKLDCQAFFIIDRQRNYRRTFINNSVSPGELVSRLYIFR